MGGFARFKQSVLLGLTLSLGLSPLAFGQAQTLEFHQVVEQALDHSYDLKIAQVDVSLGEVGVMKAFTEYLPTVNFRLNAEHLSDLSDSAASSVAAVGDTVIPSGTRFQNSVGLSASQSVFTFGSRKRKMDIARRDVDIRQQGLSQAQRELKLDVAEAYANALLAYRALQAKKEMLPVTAELYQMKDRLYKAGAISRVELAEEALRLAQATDAVEELTHKYQDALNNLASFTHENYLAKEIDMTALPSDDLAPPLPFNPEETPEYKMSALAVENKKKEMELQQRQRLPQLRMYSMYNLYGGDPSAIGRAISGIESRSMTVGFAVTAPVFDALKSKAEMARIKLEIERAELEKAKKLEELQKQYEATQQSESGYQTELSTKAALIEQSEDKLSMLERLSKQELLDKTHVLRQKVDVIQQHLDYDQTEVRQQWTRLKLQLMTES